MIFDQMERRIKDMKELRRLEMIKANRAQQEITDIKYRNLVSQVKELIEVLGYAKANLQFVISDSVQADLKQLISKLLDAVQNGYADKDMVTDGENDFKTILASIKKEWNKHHAAITTTTVNTLKVIGGIESEQVASCLADIKVAGTWQTDLTMLKRLKKSLNSAETLINKMDLDQEIIIFLTKITYGKATLTDLNEKVMAWIRKENLDSRVKLSFLSK